MEILVIGLGKMGQNLVLNLKDHGWTVCGFDACEAACKRTRDDGIEVVESLDAYLKRNNQRIIWMMVPCGDATEELVNQLLPKLKRGDILMDAGNSHYRDSVRRSKCAEGKGISYLDIGTSGGVAGARSGACLMVGGEPQAFAFMEPVFTSICVPEGCLYTGKSGSGHFLKMIHNGIEYGMMQAIGEGFQILAECEFDYDLEKAAKVWNHGSIIRCWLMELAQRAFSKHAQLEHIEGITNASGEAKWTVETAMELEIATPVIALSLMMRSISKDQNRFSTKVVAALRNEFGGHEIVEKDKH